MKTTLRGSISHNANQFASPRPTNSSYVLYTRGISGRKGIGVDLKTLDSDPPPLDTRGHSQELEEITNMLKR